MKKPGINCLPALVFVSVLMFLFAIGIRSFLVSAYIGSDYLHGFSAETFEATEKYFNEAVPTRYFFYDINSIFFKVTNRRTKGNDYRLNNGYLAYAVEKEDVAPYADAVAALNDYVTTTLNKSFLYVQFLFKIDPDDPQLPPGGEDFSNQNTEAFLTRLKANNVPVYDFRAYFKENRSDHYSLFYRTDHHWKAETGFLAAQELNRYLTAQDASFAVDERIFDRNNYHVETRDNFLGRIGLRFGPYFCGYDSFSAISPTYALDLAAYDVDGDLLHRGDAEETVLFPSHLTYDSPYNCSMYSYYLDGDFDYRHFVNRSDGMKITPKKLLIIKDSFANALAPYLIYGYQEVTIVDMRALKESLTEVIKKADPDLVMVAYDPGMLIQSEARMFAFFGSDQP